MRCMRVFCGGERSSGDVPTERESQQYAKDRDAHAGAHANYVDDDIQDNNGFCVKLDPHNATTPSFR